MDNMTLQTVDRALMILEMIAERSMTRQEIERETGLNRTTVSRLIATLANRKYAEKNPITNQFNIGLKVVELGSIKLNQIELKTEAVPLLRELSAKLKQVCHMGTLVHGEVVYIEKIEPQSSIRMFSAIGKRVPIHSTSLGKVLASGLDDEQILEILETKGMKKFTDNTLLNNSDYLKEIEKTRVNGFAVDNEENENGIFCIAAPIKDYRNQIIAAISSSGSNPLSLSTTEGMVVENVKNTAFQISKCMGYKSKR